MSLKLDENFFEFEKKLERIKDQAPNELSQFMKQQGELLKKDIKELTPKSKNKNNNNTPVGDTGHLKGGWHRRTIRNFTQIIYNDMDYINHVNYGHRTRLGSGKRKDKNSKKIEKKNGKAFVKGVYMLQKGLIKRRKEIYKDLSTKFKEVIE